MLQEERQALSAALQVVLDSNELFEECENANYHSLLDFLQECKQGLDDGEPFGYDEWNSDEEED